MPALLLSQYLKSKKIEVYCHSLIVRFDLLLVKPLSDTKLSLSRPSEDSVVSTKKQHLMRISNDDHAH